MRAQTTIRRDRFTVAVEMNLPFTPPYDWQAIIRFYQSHLIPGVERVIDGSFARVFRLDNQVGFVQVRALVAKSQVRVRVVPEDPKITSETVRRVRKMFDLDCDPGVIAKSFEKIPLLARLCRRFPGLRLARGWDSFETAICSILGQLVSAGHRENLIGQLVSNYGEQILDPSTAERTYLFPRARSPGELRSQRDQDDDRPAGGDSRLQPARPDRSDFSLGGPGSRRVSADASRNKRPRAVVG